MEIIVSIVSGKPCLGILKATEIFDVHPRIFVKKYHTVYIRIWNCTKRDYIIAVHEHDIHRIMSGAHLTVHVVFEFMAPEKFDIDVVKFCLHFLNTAGIRLLDDVWCFKGYEPIVMESDTA